jgi:hypothetical protein
MKCNIFVVFDFLTLSHSPPRCPTTRKRFCFRFGGDFRPGRRRRRFRPAGIRPWPRPPTAKTTTVEPAAPATPGRRWSQREGWHKISEMFDKLKFHLLQSKGCANIFKLIFFRHSPNQSTHFNVIYFMIIKCYMELGN